MLTRRTALSIALAPVAARAYARTPDSFDSFIAGIASEARARGISSRTVRLALDGLRPNPKVLELDRFQPEFTQTWQHYRDTRLSSQRIALGRAAYRQDRDLLAAIRTQLGVDPAVVMGIWGLETNYGGFTGGFNVVEALATLAWDGRRASYFRPELLAALGILDHGDIGFDRMTGSYAGAMGQPQFMPTSFARYAVDFDGDGKRDIWTDRSDVLASIANYLAKSGWQDGEAWGQAVTLPPDIGPGDAGREGRASLASWSRRGVRLADGRSLPRNNTPAYLLVPGGAGGEAFLAYPNFAAIRRYNPSDFYALSVGLLGDLVTG